MMVGGLSSRISHRLRVELNLNNINLMPKMPSAWFRIRNGDNFIRQPLSHQKQSHHQPHSHSFADTAAISSNSSVASRAAASLPAPTPAH